MLCRAFSRGCAVTSNRSRLQAERKCSKPPCIAGRLSLCGQRGFMDKLQKCAKAFENLLEIQYRIIIGRKGKTVELVIGFSKLDFHHLMGLGKLKDLRIAKQNRGSVFDEIITGITTYETLTKSRYLAQIENRFEPLTLVEQLLDDNRLVFRYNKKLNQFSLIEADYLLSTPFENSDIYIFIAEHKDTGKYFCRSFFRKRRRITQRDSHATPCFIKKRKTWLLEKLLSNMTGSLQKINRNF